MTKAQKFLLNFFIIDNTAEKGIRKRENVNRESHYYTFSLFSFAFAEWIYSHAITSIFSHTATNFISFSFFPFLPSNAYLSISFVLFPFLLCWTNLLSRFRNVGKDVWNNYLITCFWLWGELARYCCWTHILWQRSLQLPYASTGWQIIYFFMSFNALQSQEIKSIHYPGLIQLGEITICGHYRATGFSIHSIDDNDGLFLSIHHHKRFETSHR